jgi:hypothetical protein
MGLGLAIQQLFHSRMHKVESKIFDNLVIIKFLREGVIVVK